LASFLYRSRRFSLAPADGLIHHCRMAGRNGTTSEAGGRAPTLQDLATALGVSRTTVSNAFNRPDQLSPELRERVLEKARALGYPGPNPMARMLRTGHAGAIGLVFSDDLPYAVSDPTAIALLQGIARVCQQAGTGLLILPAKDAETARRTIGHAAVDGFILYCMPDGSDVAAGVLERGLPVVTVDQPGLPDLPAVCIDDRAGAEAAAAHAIGLGHRRLAVLSLDLLPDGWSGPVDEARLSAARYAGMVSRIEGYRAAAAAAGIDPRTIPIDERPGNTEEGGAAGARALLMRDPRPTALLCMSDRLALGALQAAAELGLDVPGDLSVIGFDDIPVASQVTPALTTVRQPLVEKGVLAAELLLTSTEPPRKHLLRAELVSRGSSGPVPVA
jgi:DNA-binding LacI/PurR family transcriptional regulator